MKEEEEEEDSLDGTPLPFIADRLSSVSVSSLCRVAEPRRRSEDDDVIRSFEESSAKSKSFCLNY